LTGKEIFVTYYFPRIANYCKELKMDIPQTLPPGDKVFTIPEVAAYLKISKSKIYDLVSRKKIPHLKVGGM